MVNTSEELDSLIFRVCAGSTQTAQTQTMGVAVSSMHHIPENLNLHHICYQNLRFPCSAAVDKHFRGTFSHFNNIQLHMLFYSHALSNLGSETTLIDVLCMNRVCLEIHDLTSEATDCVLIKFDIGYPH